jgi:hypothetical protein
MAHLSIGFNLGQRGMLLNSVPCAMGNIPAPMRKINAPHSEKRPAPKRRACLDQTDKQQQNGLINR